MEEAIVRDVLESGEARFRPKDGPVSPLDPASPSPRDGEIYLPLTILRGERLVVRLDARRFAELEQPGGRTLLEAVLALSIDGRFPAGSLVTEEEFSILTAERRLSLADLVGDHPVVREVRGMLRDQEMPRFLFLVGEQGSGKRFVSQLAIRKGKRARPFVFPILASHLSEGEWETGLPEIPEGFRLPRSWVFVVDDVEALPPKVASFLYRLFTSSTPESRPVLVGLGRGLPPDGIFSAGNNWWAEDGRLFTLPPLRERTEDLRLLTDYFLRRFAQEEGTKARGVTPEALVRMKEYPWPGNVRELKNSLERMVIQSDAPKLRESDLPPFLQDGRPAPLLSQLVSTRIGEILSLMDPSLTTGQNILVDIVREVEKIAIEHSLTRCHGCQIKAAKFLGINRNTLREKMRSYQIAGKPRKNHRNTL